MVNNQRDAAALQAQVLLGMYSSLFAVLTVGAARSF